MSFTEILLLAEKARAEQTARANLAAEARRAELAQIVEDGHTATLPPRPKPIDADEDATGFVSIKAAAKYLGVKPDSVRAYAQQGRLAYIKHKPPGERWQRMVRMDDLEDLKPEIRVAYKQLRTKPGYITPKQASEKYVVPYGTMMAHVKRGTLPAHQDSGLWVLFEDDVKQWIKQYRG